nr:hypothetical protein [Butyrivibrio sp.]
MRKSFSTKATAAITMAAMLASMTACGSSEATTADTTTAEPDTTTVAEETTATTAESTEAAEETAEETASDEYDPYQVITDDSGNPIDLGGMDIIIRDWWSGEEAEPQNDYEEALRDY